MRREVENFRGKRRHPVFDYHNHSHSSNVLHIMKGLAYGSDSDEEIATDDVFGISSIQEPASKRQRLAEQPVAGPSNITAAPNVLSQVSKLAIVSMNL